MPNTFQHSCLVCDLCCLRLLEGQRCNSGIHEGPDIPPNLFRGYPIPLERSRFTRPTDPETGKSYPRR